MRINKSFKDNNNNDRVAVKIKGIDKFDVSFNIRNTTLFKSVLDSYCDLKKLKRDEIVLLYNGIKIEEDSRPVDIDMNNDGILYAQRKEPGRSSDHDSIQLGVTRENGESIHIKMKKTDQLGQLINSACEKWGLEKKKVRFHYGGNRVYDHETPIQLEMTDDDTIDVFKYGAR